MLNPRLCTSTQNKKLSSFLAFCLLSLSFILLLGVGCTSALKKVEKDDNKVRDVFQFGLLHGILSCLPEIKEVHKIDTIVKTDTITEIKVIRKDSIHNSTDTILKKTTITKNVFIHDTVYRTMRDLSKEDALRKDNAEKEGEIKVKNEIINQQKKDLNWWKTVCFLSWGLFLIYILRKPFFRLILPAKM